MNLISSKNMPLDYKSNGCGSDTSRFDFVPDSIYTLSIFEACRRHDWAYNVGGNEQDKINADMEFLQNMLTIVGSHKKWYYPTFLARRRCMDYYEAVVRMGSDSFNWRTN